MEIYEYVKELIKPELIVLIPVCYFIGLGLLNSEKVKNQYIPLCLGAVGIVLSVIWVFGTSDIKGYRDFLMALFVAITQGVIVAGVSVFIDQLIKQKKYLNNNNT